MTQLPIDFHSPQHEAIATVRMLRSVCLPMTRGRIEGMAELMERLLLLSNDCREFDGWIECRAQVIAIAARILARTTRTERTVQNWTKDAKSLGLIEVEYSSQHYGGHSWNRYRINMSQLRTLLSEGRNGVKRGETISGLRPETISGPGGETISGLKQRSECRKPTNNSSVVVSLLDEIGLRDPQRTYSMARQSLGLTDEQILDRVAEWRELPDHQRLPGTIFNWLTKPRSYEPRAASQPGLRFQKLANCSDENTRAQLIQYGRKQGWSFQQLQAAVTRFENEKLGTLSQPMEPMPCNQHQEASP